MHLAELRQRISDLLPNTAPLPAPRQSGVFAMRCGFVAGDNVWEIDVDSRTPHSSLIVRPQLSGIHAPSSEELAQPIHGDPGSERIIEVR